MLLFINACVRSTSRTRWLADHFLKQRGLPFEELKLEDISFPLADEAFLKRRDALIEAGRFEDPLFSLARQFAGAEEIVIAAPCWDLSFPAALKQYIEQINVLGITFRYTKEGIPQGLCRAKKLTYITTAGGDFVPPAFGFGYIEALARHFYGIPAVEHFEARGLDLVGADTESILQAALSEIQKRQ